MTDEQSRAADSGLTQMNVLHAASSYPLSSGGSTAPFMEEMLRALVDAGTRVTIVVPGVRGLAEGDRDGVSVVGASHAPARFQTWGYGRSLDENGRLLPSSVALTPIALASMTAGVRRELRKSRADVVHLHWVLPSGAIALALPKDIPVVVSVHGADAKFMRGRLRPLARRVLARADALIAASSKILDTVAEIHPEARAKSRVIPHGADSRLFEGLDRSSARETLGIAQDHRVILGVGRLVGKKGFNLLLDAMGSIVDPAVELFIVGDGPDRQRLAAEAGDRVHLPGQASRLEVATWMAAADVVAVPSVEIAGDIDSGPVVLMEALAAGRAVVATAVGMAPDVIEDNVNGFLVKSTEPAELAAAITTALDSSERLGEGARRKFEEMGDWSRVAAELVDVYETAIDRRRRAAR